ncbi:MAG: hypothetical protein PF445_02540 [Melioribacteraceae bacterium]|nr:hypothetical protein [Melioribacteraceae bacterium]
MQKQIIKITSIIVILSASFSFAQMKSQVGWMSKFGLAGGLTTAWMFPNYDEINKQLPKFGISEKLSGGLLTWGGSGYVYLMIVDDLRIGGMGFGGTQSLASVSSGFNREIKYGLSGGAFTLEYTLPFVKKIAISIGGMIGGGKLTVEQYQNNDNFSWQETWDEFNNPGNTENFSRRIESNYITLTPTINIDVPLTRFFAIRVGSGYQFTMSESWTIENDKSIESVPSSLNGDAFFIQTGIYLGFFAY